MRLVDVNVMRRHMACWGGRRSGSHSRSHTHTHTHTHTLRHTQTCREWTAVKDLKATGSYLTNLKVNDFSISPHPRLISVTGIGLVNSVTWMPACWWRRGLYARLHSHRGGAQSNLKCILCFFYLFIYLFFLSTAFQLFWLSKSTYSPEALSCLKVKRSISSAWDPSICHLHQFGKRLMMRRHFQGDWEGWSPRMTNYPSFPLSDNTLFTSERDRTR